MVPCSIIIERVVPTVNGNDLRVTYHDVLPDGRWMYIECHSTLDRLWDALFYLTKAFLKCYGEP